MPARKGSIPSNKGKHLPIEPRFWAKVDKSTTPNECWTWKGARTLNHYGSFDGRGAHRVSWELANGVIPSGLEVLHHCDNPPCVRPDHLFLGNQSDNLLDCVRKGRLGYCGQKLTLSQVKEIREAYSVKKGLPQQSRIITLGQLAGKYKVAKRTIQHIVRNETWKNRP